MQTLLPSVRDRLLGLRADCNKAGYDIFFGSCCRTAAEQTSIVASGASATDHSWHVVRRACDVYCYADNGVLDMKGIGLGRYRQMHRLAEASGGMGVKGLPFSKTDGNFRLKSGKTVSDLGHIEFRDGLEWATAYAQITG